MVTKGAVLLMALALVAGACSDSDDGEGAGGDTVVHPAVVNPDAPGLESHPEFCFAFSEIRDGFAQSEFFTTIGFAETDDDPDMEVITELAEQRVEEVARLEELFDAAEATAPDQPTLELVQELRAGQSLRSLVWAERIIQGMSVQETIDTPLTAEQEERIERTAVAGSLSIEVVRFCGLPTGDEAPAPDAFELTPDE